MVIGPSQKELANVYSDLIYDQTSLGGFRLRCCQGNASDSVKFDLWRVEDTWALKKVRDKPSIDAFLKTPFLNIDSIAAEWKPKKQRWLIYEKGFSEATLRKTIDINYETNPKPLLCAIRSVSLAKRYGFKVSGKLSRFIRYQFDQASETAFREQQEHFGKLVLSYSKAKKIAAHLGPDDVSMTSTLP